MTDIVCSTDKHMASLPHCRVQLTTNHNQSALNTLRTILHSEYVFVLRYLCNVDATRRQLSTSIVVHMHTECYVLAMVL
jgi:hypothetical protein